MPRMSVGSIVGTFEVVFGFTETCVLLTLDMQSDSFSLQGGCKRAMERCHCII